MGKKYFLLICLILSIISMAAVSASDIGQTDSDTGILAVSNDDILGDGVDSGTFSELQEKINNASEGSTIELFNNYTYDDTFQADGIQINKSLTIEGNGFTIDGANKARIFFINATKDITLNNIVFANGLADLGGAILFNQSITEVNISNSVFTNNSAPDNGSVGGAINFNENASEILFENNTFENNYAGYGGSIAFDGNVALIDLIGCTFRTNKQLKSNIVGGGALYFIENAVLVFIETCEFDNLTANTGGAIHFEKRFALSVINNTKFTNNKAQTKNTEFGGGAISIEGNVDYSVIHNSEFINNSATTHGGAIKLMANTNTLFIDNTVFDGNYAPYAGALCLKGATNLTIIETEFTNNKGTDADIIGGGAIYVIGNLTNSTFETTLFENNSARAGGAIYVEGIMDNSSFEECYFINNTAFTKNHEYGGGAITVEENATNNKFENTYFIDNTATTHGGAIKFMANDENNTFYRCTFIDNYAPYGGAIAVNNSSYFLNLTDSIFTTIEEPENEIIGGGAIYFISDANVLFINGCNFDSLTARAGGAIYVEGDLSTTLINNTDFVNNKAITNNTYYGGGAIYVEGNAQFPIITECNFINNTATTHGGAIKFRGNSSYVIIGKSKFDQNYAPYAGAVALGNTSALFITATQFTDNKGTDADIVGGGAIYVIGNLTKANIRQTDFINNSARAGGAIYVEGIMDNASFEECYFLNNTAFTKNPEYGGGAIAVEGNATNNNFERVIFSDNTATTHGGAINFMDNDENNTFDRCIFIDNNAPYGGAIAVSNNSYFLNITDSIFSNSEEPENEIIGGGAIYFIGDANGLYINGCYFDSLTARAGGAIYVEGDLNQGIITNTNFNNNKAITNNTYYGGGAISIEGTALELSIKDCEFINNTASTKGGAIFIQNGKSILMDNISFSENNAEQGRALYLNDGLDVEIQNSQFINNTGLGTDIHYAGNIISSIINSTFDGISHIYTGEEAILILSNNKELDSYLTRDYFIYNEGALYLENNTLSNVIYNNGVIYSPTTMTTLINETINTTDPFIFLNAYCEDDNGNIIVSEYGRFHINDTEMKVFYNDGYILYGNTVLYEYGSYLISASTFGILFNCTQKYGIINYNPKKDAIINASDIELNTGEYGEIEVELPENATGTVTAVVDDKVYIAPVEDGKATIIIRPLEAGEYEAFIYYSGDNNYEGNYTTALVTVLEEISVVAPDVIKYYKGSERFVVTVTQSEKPIFNTTVEITINGVKYTRQTDENGTASIALGLSSGIYVANVKVDDIEVTSSVTILPTVNGTDIVKVFRNETQYYATFLDSEGNYLKDGTDVRFNINGVMYDRKVSGNEGLAKLNINLEQGEYILTAMNLVTGENTANNITVISRIIENNDITKYYRNETQYTVKIIGDDGNPVGEGENVTFNINGVFYTRQTDANGTAKLNINLQPGDYVITAEYEGCSVSNNIKVLPVLTADDLVKKYGTNTPFEAYLVDGQGKAYANQKIEFNINGVLYYRNTGSNGIAQLNINLMAGEYIITSTYNAYSTSNKVTIMP